jgi:hypothetical protein
MNINVTKDIQCIIAASHTMQSHCVHVGEGGRKVRDRWNDRGDGFMGGSMDGGMDWMRAASISSLGEDECMALMQECWLGCMDV